MEPWQALLLICSGFSLLCSPVLWFLSRTQRVKRKNETSDAKADALYALFGGTLGILIVLLTWLFK
jgi:hypothetical protein